MIFGSKRLDPREWIEIGGLVFRTTDAVAAARASVEIDGTLKDDSPTNGKTDGGLEWYTALAFREALITQAGGKP